MKKVKELTPVQSYQKVKSLLKERKRLYDKDFVPGNLIFTFYDAKFKEFTFDRTPLVLILRHNKTHTLGLNFHWILPSMRLNLIFHIIKINRKNIEQNKPIHFEYKQLKPMLKSLGYAPCIRLYINKRFAKNGIIIPPERLVEIALLKTETFTNGKYSAAELFRMASRKGKLKARMNATKRVKKVKKVNKP